MILTALGSVAAPAMTPRRRPRATAGPGITRKLLLGLSLTLALTACGTDPTGISMQNTSTLDQANQQVDQHVEQVARALSPTAAIERNDPLALHQPDMPCTDADQEDEQNYRFAQRSYPISGLPEDREKVFAAFHTWAEDNKFSVDASNADLAEDPHLRATDAAGYNATLEFKYGGYILSVSSPCVWRHGQPEPTS